MTEILNDDLGQIILDDASSTDESALPYLMRQSENKDWANIVLTEFNGEHLSFINLSVHTSLVFIGDIDFSEDFTEEIAIPLIESVEEANNINFRIYKTTKGLRVICTSELLPNPNQNRRALSLLNDLSCDPLYIRFCILRNQYAARISPKATRPEELNICEIYRTGEKIKHPEILFVVRMHDHFCLDNGEWSEEWRTMLQ